MDQRPGSGILLLLGIACFWLPQILSCKKRLEKKTVEEETGRGGADVQKKKINTYRKETPHLFLS